jgi:hypothetical protein
VDQQVIPIILPSGKEILLASETPQAEDGSSEGAPYRDVAFHLDFQDLVDTAAEIGESLRRGIQRIAPSKATVEMSVGVDAKTGKITAFLVEGAANGAIKISLEWGEKPADAS